MPDRDFTVQMWVHTPEYEETAPQMVYKLFSYATHAVSDSSDAACELP